MRHTELPTQKEQAPLSKPAKEESKPLHIPPELAEARGALLQIIRGNKRFATLLPFSSTEAIRLRQQFDALAEQLPAPQADHASSRMTAFHDTLVRYQTYAKELHALPSPHEAGTAEEMSRGFKNQETLQIGTRQLLSGLEEDVRTLTILVATGGVPRWETPDDPPPVPAYLHPSPPRNEAPFSVKDRDIGMDSTDLAGFEQQN